MRKYIYTTLIIFSLILQSCVNDEKDLFPVSATQRMVDAQLKCANILTDASDGWILNFFPNVDVAGGTQFLISFSKDNMATIAMASKSEAAKPPLTSMYHIKGDAGPVLSFDTYNKFLHYFAEPTKNGVGFEGDYEFIIMDATPDLITLKGKKSGMKMYMHRKKTPETWSEYLAKVTAMEDYLSPKKMQMNIEGQEFRALNSQNILSFKYSVDNVETNYKVPYIITDKGIVLFEPLTINGKTITAFEWDSEQLKFVCVDKGVNASFEKAVLAPNELFAEGPSAWIFNINVRGVRNASPDFLAKYDRCVQGSAAINEQLKMMYFFYSPLGMNGLGLMSGTRVAGYGMKVVPTPGTTDQVTIQFMMGADIIGGFYYKKVDGYKDFINYFAGQNFVMSEINISKIPMSIKFTDSTNPNMWFELIVVV